MLHVKVYTSRNVLDRYMSSLIRQERRIEESSSWVTLGQLDLRIEYSIDFLETNQFKKIVVER